MRPIRPVVAALSVTALALGCGGGGVTPQPADPARARAALHVALDTWKNGGAATALTQRKPPIQVADEDWLTGLRLQDYQAGPDDRLIGNNLRCPVVLTLKDPRGRTVTKNVAYTVATDPLLSVVRQDSP